MKKNSITKLRNSIQTASAAIGRLPETVKLVGKDIVIEDIGLVVSPSILNGKKFWKVFHNFQTISLDGDGERHVAVLLFEEPFGSEIALSKSVSMYIAEKAIELSLDGELS